MHRLRVKNALVETTVECGAADTQMPPIDKIIKKWSTTTTIAVISGIRGAHKHTAKQQPRPTDRTPQFRLI